MAAIFKRSRIKFILIVVFLVNLLTSLYVAYLFLTKQLTSDKVSSSENESSWRSATSTSRSESGNQVQRNQDKKSPVVVHIWGKAAIGLYLWEHVLGGSLRDVDDGLVQTGNLTMNDIVFKFSTGPGVVQGLVSTDVRYLVLVVNGRDRDKVRFATAWLDYLPALTDLRGLGLVLLGNETCDNGWLMSYMRFLGGPVDVVFLVYDSPLIDDRYFYQWPLGVATYRKFPRLRPTAIDVKSPRSHRCSFAGTIYPNSSREQLLRFVRDDTVDSTGCIVRPRFEWLPAESPESLTSYVELLLDSEMTLSPVGINAECYRIYEALSCGSIPVVENVLTRGECTLSMSVKNKDHSRGGGGPLRLLKKHGAPIVYVKDWSRDLPAVLRRQSALTEMEKVSQRRRIVEWYEKFLDALRTEFVKVIKERVVKESI